jgi:alpha-tubulin suppressor-like RCC1 family protein
VVRWAVLTLVLFGCDARTRDWAVCSNRHDDCLTGFVCDITRGRCLPVDAGMAASSGDAAAPPEDAPMTGLDTQGLTEDAPEVDDREASVSMNSVDAPVEQTRAFDQGEAAASDVPDDTASEQSADAAADAAVKGPGEACVHSSECVAPHVCNVNSGGTCGASVWASVAAGSMSACATTSDGRLFCWGSNEEGISGIGDRLRSRVLEPEEVANPAGAQVRGAVVGWLHACELMADGATHCWGFDYFGEAGTGCNTRAYAPSRVSGLPAVASLGTGFHHPCAVDGEGAVYCWGRNTSGQLGVGQADGDCHRVPARLSGIIGVGAVVGGWGHTCALKAGAVWCWGQNGDGELGDGTLQDSLSATQVVGVSDAIRLSGGSNHTCALSSSGKVVCWGLNKHGQLGDGSIKDSNRPVQVAFPPDVAEVTAIELGVSHGCAAVNGPRLLCWGQNDEGQLGNGQREDRLAPTEVTFPQPLRTVDAIGAGDAFTCAVVDGGRLFCWGANTYGTLGVGTTDDSPAPLEVRMPSPRPR